MRISTVSARGLALRVVFPDGELNDQAIWVYEPKGWFRRVWEYAAEKRGLSYDAICRHASRVEGETVVVPDDEVRLKPDGPPASGGIVEESTPSAPSNSGFEDWDSSKAVAGWSDLVIGAPEPVVWTTGLKSLSGILAKATEDGRVILDVSEDVAVNVGDGGHEYSEALLPRGRHVGFAGETHAELALRVCIPVSNLAARIEETQAEIKRRCPWPPKVTHRHAGRIELL